MPVAQPTVQHDFSPKPPHEDLKQILQDDLINVNKMIITYLSSDVTLIPRIAQHLILAGGKRIRPLITCAAAKLCGYTGTRHIPLAASIEFVHAATLLHDDVIDESTTRRNQPTANALWGNKASILVGDFLFARAFELMVKTDSITVLETIAEASKKISEGEILQLDALHNIEISKENYFRIIAAKTATLFSAGCKSGAMLATDDAAKISALHAFGHNLGMVFQIIDDILDYTGDARTIGKDIGNDIREGKVTLPLIRAFEAASPTQKTFIEGLLTGKTIDEKDFNQLHLILGEHQSIESCYSTALTYYEKALESLDIFPDTPLKSSLQALALQSTRRHA